MIIQLELDKHTTHTTTWLVWAGEKSVRIHTERQPRKHRIREMRDAIVMAFRGYGFDNIEFLGNKRGARGWYTEWRVS